MRSRRRRRSPPSGLDLSINKALGLPAIAGGAAVQPTPTLGQLVLRQDVGSAVYWLAGGILSAILGFSLLIANNPSFGQWDDYVAALLWGLGLTSATTKLSGVTTAQLRTALRPPAQ